MEPTVIVFVGMPQAFDGFLEELVYPDRPGLLLVERAGVLRIYRMRALESGGLAGPRLGPTFPSPRAVARNVPGPVPWVLYKMNDREQQVRVFSAGPELGEMARVAR